MDMNNERSLTAVSCLTSLTHESAEDFTLPDYMPAIRRVISVTASPLPESRFLTGAAMEFGGTIAYSVLYLGEGDEIYCAPLTSEYSASVALGDSVISDASAVGIDTSSENVTCRVIAPRKLTLKCRMKTKIAAFAPVPLTETVKDSAGRPVNAGEWNLERLIGSSPDVQIARGELTATVGGTLNLAPGTKILACDGAIRVEEVRPGQDTVSVQGDGVVHLLCLSPDGAFFTTSAKGRFGETVSVSGAADGDAARAWGRSAAVTINTADESAGTWEIEFDLEAESARAAETSYTADAYATSCASGVEMAERDSLRLLKCGIGALSFSGESGRQSKSVPGEKILRVDATVHPDHVECETGKGRLTLHGVAAVRVLIAAEGDVIVEEFSLPLRYETDAAAIPTSADLLWRCSADVIDGTARTEGDKIAVNLDLSLSMTVLSREKIRYVQAIVLETSAGTPAEDSTVRICYPDAGEPIWEIGKRYRSCLRTLCERNGIADAHAVCSGEPILV